LHRFLFPQTNIWTPQILSNHLNYLENSIFICGKVNNNEKEEQEQLRQLRQPTPHLVTTHCVLLVLAVLQDNYVLLDCAMLKWMVGVCQDAHGGVYSHEINDAVRFVLLDGWDTQHIQFVQEFASVVSVLQVCDLSGSLGLWMLLTAQQDKTNDVINLYKDILHAMEDLATCSYTEDAFTELLSHVQSTMHLRSQYHWVAELEKKIERILLQQLKHIA
jgi:hypothetical protein